MDKRAICVLAGGVLLRLLLFTAFPSLPTLLGNRVEIATPVTSFKRLQEGLFLYTHGVSPYDGGVFHQAPLLLAFFSTIPSSPIVTNLVYIVADVLSALALMDIARSGVSTVSRLHTSNRKDNSWSPWGVAAAFLFNPFTVATCIGRPTVVFTNTVILTAIARAAQGRAVASTLALAMSAYLSLYPVLLLPPLILLSYDCVKQKSPASSPTSLCKFALTQTTLFLTALLSLLGLSFGITSNSWEFLSSTYGVHLLLPDLTPNVGLWWYFFIEMFDSFREFFLCVFQLHLLIYVGGLTIRLRKQPLFVIITMLGILSIFKSYPAIGDTALYMALLTLYRHVVPLMRYSFVATSAIIYATLLGPAFYHLWIYAGSGNANFFYAITLVWSLAMAVVVADGLYAVLRDEWETEVPGMEGKKVLQI
ncbi:GPI transamidase subunit PIG-U [Kalaharituber pfeilii]|nr:GPI transamidase subunit PIG-U [Kalaharituber pfeilii]